MPSSDLDDVFQFVEAVQLRGEGVATSGCGAICVARSSHTYLLDPRAKRVIVFDPAGKLINIIGGPGDGPGEFMFPGAAKLDLRDDLFVVDISRKRISIFSLEAGFRDSLLLTGPQSRISDIRITSNGSLLTSGFTRTSSDNPEFGEWISRYDAHGKYLGSFFPSSAYNRNWAWRISPGCLFDTDLDDNIYAVQHCDYRIEKYGEKGNFLTKFGPPPIDFVHPDTKKPFNARSYASRSRLESELRAFAHSWTRIVNILVIGNRYVLVVLETNNLVPGIKSKYLIDIWDKDGRLVRGGIRTDMRLVNKDPHDYLYFIKEDNESSESSCMISKYSFRMDQHE